MLQPLAIAGADLWIDATLPFVAVPSVGNAAGAFDSPLPIPAQSALIGQLLFAQYLLLEPPACMPLGISSSDAVERQIQP